MKDILKVMGYVYIAQTNSPGYQLTEYSLGGSFGKVSVTKFKEYCFRYREPLAQVSDGGIRLTARGIEKYYQLVEDEKARQREKVQVLSSATMAAFTTVLGFDVIYRWLTLGTTIGLAFAFLLFLLCLGIILVLNKTLNEM